MRFSFLPKTSPGKWSSGLIIVFMLSLGLFYTFCATGQRGGATFFSNLTLTIPILIAAIAGISALFIGLFGIIRSRERSISVYLSVIIGLFVLVFCLGEIISPH